MGDLPLDFVREAPPPPCDRTHQTPQGPPCGKTALLLYHALALLSGQVGDAAGGWLACERGVAAVVMVGVQPVGGGVALPVAACGVYVGDVVITPAMLTDSRTDLGSGGGSNYVRTFVLIAPPRLVNRTAGWLL